MRIEFVRNYIFQLKYKLYYMFNSFADSDDTLLATSVLFVFITKLDY